MKKRSQITLFVIIGIVILFSTLIVLYIRSQVTGDPLVILDKDPVTDYVEHCLLQVTEDAVLLAGQQGGYVDVNPDKVAELLPFDSPLLSVSGRLYIPYWLYQDSGRDRSEMPALHKSYDEDRSIQWQIEHYIAEHIPECVDFEVLASQGLDVSEMGILEPGVIITEESVNVKLHYPLKIYEDETVNTKSDFFAEIPVRLGRIYRLAKEIRDYEMSTVFLERNTMNLITLYSKIDNDYLPPMYGGLHFVSCADQEWWLYDDVYSDMDEMLTANIPFLHVAQTDFDPIIIEGSDKAIRQGVYNNMIHQVSDNTYPFISADFEYMDQMELDVGSRGILQPLSYEIDLGFSFLCMFEYQFPYNLKYPVLISLTDSESKLRNRDYIFQFPMIVVLKDNHPRVSYAEAFGKIPVPEVSSECDPEYRLSADMTVNVVDIDGNGIDGATLMFQCGPNMIYEFHDNGTIKDISVFADNCHIGSTKDGFLQKRFPQCSGGGMLTVKANGYVQKTELVGSTMGEERTFDFMLDKVYEKEVTVSKIFVKARSDLQNPGIVVDGDDVVACNTDGEVMKLQTFEHALVRLNKVDEENGIVRSPPFAYYNPKNTSTIMIAPGTYTVDILLFRNERFNGEMTIRKNSETRTIPGGLGADKRITYPDKDVLLPTIVSGGAEFEWTITAEELEKYDVIEFRTFDEGAPLIIEDVGTPAGHRDTCSQMNYELIKPRLK